MVATTEKKVDYLVVDTTAFIENAPLQNFARTIVTVQDVIDEITNKRQLRRLVVLPYDLVIKDVFPENIRVITEFSQKTGDYPNLSATDIKVMALTYQLEKAEVGTDHLRKEPLVRQSVNVTRPQGEEKINSDVAGFYMPKSDKNIDDTANALEELTLESTTSEDDEYSDVSDGDEDDNDDDGWITPSNVKEAKKQLDSENLEEKIVKVACITTDFAMQNVLKQMNLNVTALDGRIIKQLKTYILRCYTCFKTTSTMTLKFCPKCGNATLKRVSVSVDENGKQKIHINAGRPLTARGKKFSLPTMHGGKHSNNPILAPDQPLPDQRPTRLARMKNNPLDDDYVAGFSPFVMRDVNSKSAQLGIRSAKEVKHWMRKNPNEARRRKK